jgi:hypothetical protein
MTTEIVIGLGGDVQSIYGEEFDFACLGEVQIRRASFVEPDDQGRWFADLSPMGGPKLGPFTKRSAALDAEVQWLRCHVLRVTEPKEDSCGQS